MAAQARPRLILYLSGRWKRAHADLLRAGDILWRGPDTDAPPGTGPWQVLPRLPRDEAPLLSQYAALWASTGMSAGEDFARALANKHYLYGVLAVAAQLEAVSRLIDEHQPAEVLIFSAGPSHEPVPAVGFANSESATGSRDLIGAIVAGVLEGQITGCKVRIEPLSGDLMMNLRIRRPLMRAATTALVGLSALKLMAGRITRRSVMRDAVRTLVFVRTREHARHCARIFGGQEGVAALITPQFTQGGARGILDALGDAVPAAFPSLAATLKALAAALLPSRRSAPGASAAMTCAGFTCRVSLDSVQRDLHATRLFAFQRALISASLRDYPDLRACAGFEVQGPFAWIEGCEPRRLGLSSMTIQSVLVQGRSIPLFPCSDRFFVDSAPNARLLADVGAEAPGRVVYAGPPFAVRPVQAQATIKRIGFFTQPYEHDLSARVLERLCETAARIGAEVVLRLHPRDTPAPYAAVMARHGGLCTLSQGEPLSDLIARLDLCVTRTSSVTKEALASGKMVLNVLISDFDRAISADYLPGKGAADGGGTIARSLDEIGTRIMAREQLAADSAALAQHLFAGLTLADFLREIDLSESGT
ncbi:MAG: hypothetical protein ACK4E3_05055 [Brevundimonas sp.]|uniref:hypothetical protein n=1 Tax=Brevundimonas sp. TaxID=1871086 RepID=UPI00391B7249